ncbi:MAG: small conductance mechanosensitive channel [Candidatus Nanohaloarchaea archaeon]|jgi:small conductance mechanosensitive channel
MIENILYSNQIYFQLARFTVFLVLGVLATRLILMPIVVKIMSRRGTSTKARHSIENIVTLIGLFTALLVALQAASFGNLLTILGTLAAAATVAVGFGMRDQVASVVAGVFIHMDNPFVKGDYIKVNETEGIIKNISLRTTTLNGKNNAEQVVPNNILTTNVVKNYTRGNVTKVSIETLIEADKAETASDLLLNSINENEGTLDKPEPEIRYRKISEGKTDMEATFWIRDAGKLKSTRSSVLQDYSEKAEKEGLFEKSEEED